MQHRYFFSNVPRMLALATALVLVNAALILAQLSTAKVEGIVRDKDSGKPLQGAQVTIEGTRLGNVTNADGYYFILNVPPGRQSITFTFTGYQKTTVSDQLLLAGQTNTVNATLSGTVVELQGITVEGESEVLMPRDNTVTKARLTTVEMNETPTTKLEDLMLLQAGVQTGGQDALGRGLRIRGGRLGEEGMIVDGVMVRNYTANPFASGQGWINETEIGSQATDTTPLEFSTDAVEQVDIITGGFQAEYGNAQSGIINIVTKEGGADYRGSVRYTTDGQQPRTSDWGYNQVQASAGGPVPVIKNAYFHVSGELQGFMDRTPTHADEGFRGVNQLFVDRLNSAVRNDPVLGQLTTPYTLEMFQTARNFYATQTGARASLFSPLNPVRLPDNWMDRTMTQAKLTYSPIKGLKLIGTNSWSRNQQSYPSGYSAQGDYFQDGVVDRRTDFYKNYLDVYWNQSPYFLKGDSVEYVPQSHARRTKTYYTLLGADWDFWQTATRSATLQLRYAKMDNPNVNNASQLTDWRRSDFLSWTPHDIRFEIESWPGREGLYTPDLVKQYAPDGITGWKQYVPEEGPFAVETSNTFYYVSYQYMRENQNNYKADLDYQINRRNRAKLGFQSVDFSNDRFSTQYNSEKRDPLDEFKFHPLIFDAYGQNRTDLGDFVFDYGLRYDGFNHRANWGINRGDIYGENVTPRSLHVWSPRFDVAFPVTDKSQLRFSYGVFSQLPSMGEMYGQSYGGNPFLNPGDLSYSRTDAFESGVTYLVSTNQVLDVVAFYRDINGNVANKAYFRDYYAWHQEQRFRGWNDGLVNRDDGNIKGVDVTLRRRFSDNFSYNLQYTLQFSRTTGDGLNGWSSGNYDATSNSIFAPPDELRPISGDQTHKMSVVFNYMFPQDYRAGTAYNTVLRNVRAYAVFQLQSGEPLLQRNGSSYTSSADPALTSQWGGYNFFRGRWYTNLDTRFSKQFTLGGSRRVSVFGEVYNVFNRKTNYHYPTGYTLEGYSHVTGGVDLKWSDLTPSDGARVRFNADFNADGILTVDEAAMGAIAESFVFATMDKRLWGTARQIRTGLDFSF